MVRDALGVDGLLPFWGGLGRLAERFGWKSVARSSREESESSSSSSELLTIRPGALLDAAGCGDDIGMSCGASGLVGGLDRLEARLC